MNQDTPFGARVIETTIALGTEEEAWYRRDERLGEPSAIRAWCKARTIVCSDSGNPLADDEDAWCRP